MILSFFIKFCDNSLTVIFRELSGRVTGIWLIIEKINIKSPSKTERNVKLLVKTVIFGRILCHFLRKNPVVEFEAFLRVSRRFEQKYEKFCFLVKPSSSYNFYIMSFLTSIDGGSCVIIWKVWKVLKPHDHPIFTFSENVGL